MIYIQRGQSNTVVTTLTERVSLNDPKFLFVFRNEQTGEYLTCLAADLSEHTERYNMFTITEKSNPNNLIGEIYLPLTGFYAYEVHEQESDSNLDRDLSGALLEIGRMQVIGTSAGIITPSDNSSTIVFNP